MREGGGSGREDLWRERERERERERHSDRQTDRQTERQTYKQTETERDRETKVSHKNSIPQVANTHPHLLQLPGH